MDFMAKISPAAFSVRITKCFLVESHIGVYSSCSRQKPRLMTWRKESDLLDTLTSLSIRTDA